MSSLQEFDIYFYIKRMECESPTIVGVSPVSLNILICIYKFLSRIRHVEPGLKLGRPLSKAK
jgi:hypothetical protein